MHQPLYTERSWNPLARTVELTEEGLLRGGRITPLSELNLAAMAEAFRRGQWLGGGGTERPLERLAEGSGVVPVTRVTGTTAPVRVRQAAAFARALGELAVRCCGGPARLDVLAGQARGEGVPLWIARRYAHGPAGPVGVAVDRRLVRVDVWGPGAPAVRIRAPHGCVSSTADRAQGLRMTVGDVPAVLVLAKKMRKSKSYVQARLPQGVWELWRANRTSSWLLRDGQRVALIQRPPRRPVLDPGSVLLPLAAVRYESADPLDAVMAQTFAVALGLGDTTGTARFRIRRTGSDEPIATDVDWDRTWFSNLGSGSDDNESGGSDGWGSDGGDGGSGGGDSGGGDGGGSGGGGD
ncbi:hypothetical protein OG897_29115 [Streptomyces sp. NBC_00237]|uniref:hypothetical protein n=1 Tax=Streptomyces sp. NBC_00237 TaxID=2975687 RepID=UPI002252FDB4|nr:hypothetical protein [Streptomyces sp. NBC_00237]MCX5205507.1 hypothetical protein [Streptomyces sp. NBC_00237]